MSIGQELLNVPMSEMIASMAVAIAEAQLELDETSLESALIMAGKPREITNEDGSTTTVETTVAFPDADGTERETSLIELGFTPTFYQFVDTIVEVKIAIRITRETEASLSMHHGRTNSGTRRRNKSVRKNKFVRTTSVDASYSSKYNYSAEGSSLIRTKIVPVPPPSLLEDRIRALSEA